MSTEKRTADGKSTGPAGSKRSWNPNFASHGPWISLLLLAAVLLHRSYFFTTGTINWGDFYWISPDTLHEYQRLPAMWESMWGVGISNGQINIGPVYWVMGLLGRVGFTAPMAERVLIFWPMSIMPF